MNGGSENDRPIIRWGIIGAGNVAEFKSGPALMQAPGSTVVAVMRRDTEKARDFALRCGVPRWYGDVDALLADPEVDAIYVASPHHLHLAHVTRAAQAGKAILCEKPVGVSTAEAQTVVDVCRAASVSLSVAYYRRYWPVVQEMRRRLADGAIGEVVQARVQLADQYVPDPQRSWLTEPEQAGGGALANAGSHWIDLIRYLLGDVVEVTATCSGHFGGFKTEDTIGVQMRLASQALVSLNVTLCSPAAVNEFDIAGTGGRLFAGPLSDGRLILQRGNREPELLHLPRSTAAHMELVTEVVRTLATSTPSPVPGEDAVAVWQIIAAAYLSCGERRHVPVIEPNKRLIAGISEDNP
jgi:1,5-anhydro-D-fructose reductase (1,5-anhydro-D-mannitol-forming)